MSIDPQSRYSQPSASLVRVPDSSNTYNLTVFRTVPLASIQFSLYVWQSGDRVDMVAARQYGNPSLWWAIFDINPEIIDPTNIPPGTIVRLPAAPVMGQGTLLQ